MKLSKITKVNPRDIWKHEAYDFTNWLKEEDNINIICEELDLNLDNIQTEGPAGRYSVDIVADDIDRKCKVIIENQLEATDHKHLGQILTYASSYDASIIIWLVTDYTEEHRQAIDWFNRNMNDSISFFLIQIEVIKISDSPPAPQLNIISQPNTWGKAIKQSSTGDKNSELKLLQNEFWEGLKNYSIENNLSIKMGHSPRPQHWYNVSFGTSKCNLAFTMNTSKNYIGCELYIRNNMDLFNNFYKNKDDIEAIIGEKLEWMDLPEATASRIIIKNHCDPKKRSEWNKLYSWCSQTGILFESAFKKYIN